MHYIYIETIMTNHYHSNHQKWVNSTNSNEWNRTCIQMTLAYYENYVNKIKCESSPKLQNRSEIIARKIMRTNLLNTSR